MCAGRDICPGKAWEGPSLSSLTNHKTLCKQGVEAKAELSTFIESVPQHT